MKLPEIFRSRLLGVLLTVTLIVTFVCYQKGMTASFSSDDYPHLPKNMHFQNIFDALTVFLEFDGRFEFDDREYRPIVRFSMWLNYQITQDAKAFHYTNLILHLTIVVCLYFLLILLLENRVHAFLASLLFALHPIHTTNVFFIYGRTDLIFGFFYMNALLMFFIYWKRGRDRKFHILSLAFFVLGLLSKEMAASFPILLFSILMIMETGDLRRRALIALRQTSIYLLMTCVYVAIRAYYWTNDPASVKGYLDYEPFSILTNLAMWLFGLFYPFDLYHMRNWYESDTLHFLSVVLLICIVFLAIIHVAMRNEWRNFLNDKVLHLSGAWFLVTLLPIIGGNAHRWYLYIPSVAFSLFLVAILRSVRRKAVFHVILSVCLISYTIELLHQSGIWKRQDEIARELLDQLQNISNESATYYFANMPFGYKSSFLFTFDSAIHAVYFHSGFRPDIRILSYVNLSDEDALDIERLSEEGNLRFRIESDAYGYFLFPPARRRFESEDIILKIHETEVEIEALSPAGTASRYEIRWPGRRLYPLYYFDGERIRLFEQ